MTFFPVQYSIRDYETIGIGPVFLFDCDKIGNSTLNNDTSSSASLLLASSYLHKEEEEEQQQQPSQQLRKEHEQQQNLSLTAAQSLLDHQENQHKHQQNLNKETLQQQEPLQQQSIETCLQTPSCHSSYNKSLLLFSSSCTFVSMEMIGTIKSIPEDFIVREIIPNIVKSPLSSSSGVSSTVSTTTKMMATNNTKQQTVISYRWQKDDLVDNSTASAQPQPQPQSEQEQEREKEQEQQELQNNKKRKRSNDFEVIETNEEEDDGDDNKDKNSTTTIVSTTNVPMIINEDGVPSTTHVITTTDTTTTAAYMIADINLGCTTISRTTFRNNNTSSSFSVINQHDEQQQQQQQPLQEKTGLRDDTIEKMALNNAPRIACDNSAIKSATTGTTVEPISMMTMTCPASATNIGTAIGISNATSSSNSNTGSNRHCRTTCGIDLLREILLEHPLAVAITSNAKIAMAVATKQTQNSPHTTAETTTITTNINRDEGRNNNSIINKSLSFNNNDNNSDPMVIVEKSNSTIKILESLKQLHNTALQTIQNKHNNAVRTISIAQEVTENEECVDNDESKNAINNNNNNNNNDNNNNHSRTCSPTSIAQTPIAISTTIFLTFVGITSSTGVSNTSSLPTATMTTNLSSTIKNEQYLDRTKFHEALREAFPLLRSEAVSNNNQGRNTHYIGGTDTNDTNKTNDSNGNTNNGDTCSRQFTVTTTTKTSSPPTTATAIVSSTLSSLHDYNDFAYYTIQITIDTYFHELITYLYQPEIDIPILMQYYKRGYCYTNNDSNGSNTNTNNNDKKNSNDDNHPEADHPTNIINDGTTHSSFGSNSNSNSASRSDRRSMFRRNKMNGKRWNGNHQTNMTIEATASDTTTTAVDIPILLLKPNSTKIDRRFVHQFIDTKTKGQLGTNTIPDFPLKRNSSKSDTGTAGAVPLETTAPTTAAITVQWTNIARRKHEQRIRKNMMMNVTDRSNKNPSVTISTNTNTNASGSSSRSNSKMIVENHDDDCNAKRKYNDKATAAVDLSKSGTSAGTNRRQYTLCVIRKRNQEHLTAVTLLSKAFRCRQPDIGLAGMKDKNAVTYQFCTIAAGSNNNVLNGNALSQVQHQQQKQHGRILEGRKFLLSKGMDVSIVGDVDDPLRKGDLIGNQFEIILRSVQRVRVVIDCGDADRNVGISSTSGSHPNDDSVVQTNKVSTVYEDFFTPMGGEDVDKYIDQSVQRLLAYGFVNFYGEQRVGEPGHESITGVRAFDIGRAMLQHDYMKAINLILNGRKLINGRRCGAHYTPDLGTDTTPTTVTLNDSANQNYEPQNQENIGNEIDAFRQEWITSKGDIASTIKKLPHGGGSSSCNNASGGTAAMNTLSSSSLSWMLPRERLVLNGLKRYGKENPLAALRCLQHSDRIFFIHAYQAYVWNMMTTERLKRYGTKVIRGDIVMRNGTVKIVPDDEDHFCYNINNNNEKSSMLHSAAHQNENPMTTTLSIYDVILPLPGYDVLYPQNEIGMLYKDVLAKDGIEFHKVSKQIPEEGTSKGSYRFIVAKVLDNKIKWCEVTNVPTPTNVTPSERSITCPASKAGISNSVCGRNAVSSSASGVNNLTNEKELDIKFIFRLPKGCYATMFFRELMLTTVVRDVPMLLNEEEGQQQQQKSS